MGAPTHIHCTRWMQYNVELQKCRSQFKSGSSGAKCFLFHLTAAAVHLPEIKYAFAPRHSSKIRAKAGHLPIFPKLIANSPRIHPNHSATGPKHDHNADATRPKRSAIRAPLLWSSTLASSLLVACLNQKLQHKIHCHLSQTTQLR